MQRKQGDRRHYAAGRSAAIDIEAELSKLPAFSIDKLRADWKDRFGADAPAIRSPDVMRRLLAWQIQADAYSGLDANTERELRSIATKLERDGMYEPAIRRDLSPGVVLMREWKGTTHRVVATADGFQHEGKRYKSLSDIARTITGTRWSGPRFFGLEQKASRPTGKTLP